MTPAQSFANVRRKPIPALVIAFSPLVLVACGPTAEQSENGQPAKVCASVEQSPVLIKGGAFLMGSEAVYAEEGPVHEVSVEDFWLDRHEVTNRQFAEFVRATSYITDAEKPVDLSLFDVEIDQIPPHMLEPGSAVFDPPSGHSKNFADWWKYVPGANWERPFGPSGHVARLDEPVVHLSLADMMAYANWKGGRLPTEAEWEYAASAGEEKSPAQPSPAHANSWQGIFPLVNEATDGFKGVAPVGCFKPNAFGLFDMVGNVWEVTADNYQPGHYRAERPNPEVVSDYSEPGPPQAEKVHRVMKGGSFLCAPNYCQRYRAQARQGKDPNIGASNVGFRLAYDEPPQT